MRNIAARGKGGREYTALIDTGALITGYTNEQVARKLLEYGLVGLDACVFIDGDDRRMVVDRSLNAAPVPLDRSGIKIEKRFTFYDQVHTTGMDIKQALDACAVVTLGKDMTLRDYSQGCWRMRGLGKGQRIHLLVVQEVKQLIAETVHPSHHQGDMSAAKTVVPIRQPLVDVVAWLVTNSMRSEMIQFCSCNFKW